MRGALSIHIADYKIIIKIVNSPPHRDILASVQIPRQARDDIKNLRRTGRRWSGGLERAGGGQRELQSQHCRSGDAESEADTFGYL